MFISKMFGGITSPFGFLKLVIYHFFSLVTIILWGFHLLSTFF